jgi:hypothetical protein
MSVEKPLNWYVEEQPNLGDVDVGKKSFEELMGGYGVLSDDVLLRLVEHYDGVGGVLPPSIVEEVKNRGLEEK